MSPYLWVFYDELGEVEEVMSGGGPTCIWFSIPFA